MSVSAARLKAIVATGFAIVTFSLPAAAQEDDENALLQQLRDADSARAGRIAARLRNEWSKSGSATMDLLLKRGRDAMEAQDFAAAIEHLTALTDHAPDFAEGWNARAMAWFNTGRLGPAMADLERALALNPHHFGALRGVGAVLEQAGNPVLAHEAYSRVLEINPHDSDVIEAIDRLAPLVRGIEL